MGSDLFMDPGPAYREDVRKLKARLERITKSVVELMRLHRNSPRYDLFLLIREQSRTEGRPLVEER